MMLQVYIQKKPDVAQAIWPKSFARATPWWTNAQSQLAHLLTGYIERLTSVPDDVWLDVALQLCSCCSNDDDVFFCSKSACHAPPAHSLSHLSGVLVALHGRVPLRKETLEAFARMHRCSWRHAPQIQCAAQGTA